MSREHGGTHHSVSWADETYGRKLGNSATSGNSGPSLSSESVASSLPYIARSGAAAEPSSAGTYGHIDESGMGVASPEYSSDGRNSLVVTRILGSLETQHCLRLSSESREGRGSRLHS